MQHHYLREDEVQAIRDGVSRRRVPGAYVPGRWSVSHYNREPRVVTERFPARVAIRDITLRTLEQAYGAPLRDDERVVLARALIEAGVQHLQTAFGAWSNIHDQVSAIRALDFKGEIAVEGILESRQVEELADAGANLAQFQNPSIPEITPIYLWATYDQAWKGEDWRKTWFPTSAEEQVERIAGLIGTAKKFGVRSAAGVSMLAYATDEYLTTYCGGVAKAGVDQIVLYDGSGGMGPEAWRYVVRLVRKVAPGVEIGVHAHNVFGLGNANTLAAIQAGADVVEVSVNYLCSASGQADLAEVAASLEILYGVDTGIRLEKLTPLRRLVEDLSRIPMAPNKPITGEHAWAYHEEICVQEMPVEPMLHYSVRPEVFGNKAELYIGKASGNWTMYDKLLALGVEFDRAAVPEILKRVKAEMVTRKRVLADDEIRLIARSFRPTATDVAAQHGPPVASR